MIRRFWKSVTSRMRLFTIRLRSYRDYVIFVLRHRAGFRASLASFALAVVLFAAAPVGPNRLLTALGVVSLVLAVAEYRRQLLAMSDLQIVPASMDLGTIHPPKDHDLITLVRPGSVADHAIRVDRSVLAARGLLEPSPIGLAVLGGARYRVPDELRSVAAAVLFGHYRRVDAAHFNGVVVRQSSDFSASGDVILARASYFDLLVTNYLAASNVFDRHGEILVEGPDWLTEFDAAGRLRVTSLESSRLANTIGVSALAFTADVPARLLLVRQSGRSSSSAGMWAPSSSGSVDAQDLNDVEPGVPFLFANLIMRAMERELCEEGNIEATEIAETRILGAYRWLNKGGKPEYVGVCRLLVTEAELRLRPRVEERMWVSRVMAVDGVTLRKLLSGDVLSALPDRGRAHGQKDKRHMRDLASFPLYMCLRALATEVRDDKTLRTWLAG